MLLTLSWMLLLQIKIDYCKFYRPNVSPKRLVFIFEHWSTEITYEGKILLIVNYSVQTSQLSISWLTPIVCGKCNMLKTLWRLKMKKDFEWGCDILRRIFHGRWGLIFLVTLVFLDGETSAHQKIKKLRG